MKKNKIDIYNIIIEQEKNKLSILVNTNSDIIAIYVLLQFFIKKTEIIEKLFVILNDQDGSSSYNVENAYEIADYTLNDFLFYYSKLKNAKEYSSNIMGEGGYNIIVGWLMLTKEYIKLTESDINFIDKKIMDYRVYKFRKKEI